MEKMLSFLPAEWLSYYKQIPAQWLFFGFNLLFLVVSAVGLWLAYYSFRRAFGYQRFKGHWYSHDNFEILKQELYSGVRDGRLPDSETMRLLDRHVYGRKGSQLRNINGNGWL